MAGKGPKKIAATKATGKGRRKAKAQQSPKR